MKTRPQLSFWQIWNMSFGFFGIQFGFALQNANVSRIFENLGASVEDIPILWIAAPVTGLIIQPIIGHMSDKTWCRLGRRRPYFLAGAILASIALLIMPNSPALWVAAGMLWIMDASINISMEPFRAFVGDMLPSKQRTTGFSMQSFFIGTGAVIASALPYVLANWFGVPNEAAEGERIPMTVKLSFYIGGAVFLLAVLWTVFSTKEYSPEEMKAFDKEDVNNDEATTGKTARKTASDYKKAFFRNALLWILGGLIPTALIAYFHLEAELYILSMGFIVYGIIQLVCGFMAKSGNTTNGLIAVITDLYNMPKTMGQLAFVQFFSWFALFAMWIYTTAGVTSHVYDMNIDKDAYVEIGMAFQAYSMHNDDDPSERYGKQLAKLDKQFKDGKEKAVIDLGLAEYLIEHSAQLGISDRTVTMLDNVRQEFNKGANWVGVCFAIYNGFAALFAFLLMFLARITNRKTTHMISLIIGGIGLISIFFINNPDLILISFVGIGLAWASILAMPYAILTGSLPSDKMGTYMGIFNFFIVIPQIIAASLLGFLVKGLFEGQAIYALILGGISMFVAAALVMIVNDKD